MWMGFGFLFWILFAVALVFALGRRPQGESATRDNPLPGETPLEIARRRSASGELSADEFGAIRRQLNE